MEKLDLGDRVLELQRWGGDVGMIQFGGGQPPAIPDPWARTLGQLSDMQTASVIRTYNWPWFWSQVALAASAAQQQGWERQFAAMWHDDLRVIGIPWFWAQVAQAALEQERLTMARDAVGLPADPEDRTDHERLVAHMVAAPELVLDALELVIREEHVAWFWSQVAQAALCRELLEWQRTGEVPTWAR